MVTDIIKIIDDKIYWMYKVVTEDWPQDEYYSEWQQALLDLKKEILRMPRTISEIDLELLQRYDEYYDDVGGVFERDNGQFIRYSALIQLLK